MLVRPVRQELPVIGRFLGKVSVLIGFLTILCASVSLAFGEIASAVRLATGGFGSFLAGLLLLRIPPSEVELSGAGSFFLAAVVWLFSTLQVGWTYWLTGHFGSYLDACFDVMSGFTTTGLVLIQDLEHAPEGLQFLRHLITFVGGQGIIALFLAIILKDSPLFFQLYVGEGKDERLWPNVLHTARTIWKVSTFYLLFGSAALYMVLRNLGMEPIRAILDSIYLFEGAWSTGGFAPHVQNLLYYHSPGIDLLTMVIFIVGSLNFFVHSRAFSGDLGEILMNSEVRSFFVTVTILTGIALFSCYQSGIYPTAEVAFRKVVYQMTSAHTTTGNMTIYARQFINDWPPVAFLACIIAMAIGGSACSTAGGVKGIRIVQIVKGILFEVKQMLLPPSAMTVVRIHHGQDRLITQAMVYKGFIFGIMFVGLYILAAMAGVAAGFPISDSLFEGVSAASNSGLSCGMTSPSMPWGLKITYILVMWLGRMEFIAVLVGAGYLVSWVKGR